MSKKIIQRSEAEHSKANPEPLKILIAVAPFLIGLYYEWTSAVACVFILGYLWYCFKYTGQIKIFGTLALTAAVVLSAAYGFSTFWAVDSGMALFGMVKFLPLPLFVLATEQLAVEQREELLDYIPISGIIMMAASWGLGFIPGFDTYFRVNERLAGFFQYPNAFALYLLVGVIVLISNQISQKEWNNTKGLQLLLLFSGIILTGSRTGFALLILTILCFCVLSKDRKVRIGISGAAILLTASASIYALITGNMDSVGRYLTISLSSSTFLGRILYFKDALPVIMQHPFGLGYEGYYFVQGSFQTGVYSVVNIHNELLQILLDVGWIPAGIIAWTVVKGIVSGNMRNRILIVMIILHSMMDFNLQFVSIFIILFAAINLNEKNIKKLSKKSLLITATALIGCVCLYFGGDSALYYFKMYSAAAQFYPGNTNAWMQLLTETEKAKEMEEIADKILVLNPDNPLANNAKARVAYSKGDFSNMIRYKTHALDFYRYDLAEYLDYFNMLYVGYQIYLGNNDPSSAEVCVEQMREIPERIEKVLEETDPLAYEIQDKPELKLPEEYQEILQAIG